MRSMNLFGFIPLRDAFIFMFFNGHGWLRSTFTAQTSSMGSWLDAMGGEVGGTGGRMSKRWFKRNNRFDGGTGSTLCLPDAVYEVREEEYVEFMGRTCFPYG